MEKLADGLQKLSEDDLLHVVTMIHDNKTSETYTKNDVESMYALGGGWGVDPFFAHGMLTCVRRRRVPRRPVHPAGLACQDAVGFHG